MKPILIISHRRSGTHFLWETLKLNFGVDSSSKKEGKMGGFKYHRPLKSANAKHLMSNNTCIYLVRDGRNVLVSSYYYWWAGKEPSYKVQEIFKNMSFSQYLRGEASAVVKEVRKDNPKVGDLFGAPIDHWLDYNEWSDKLFTVRFEDIKNNLKNTLWEISEYIDVPLKSKKIKSVDRLVGHMPRKGIIGDWRNYFSEEDLDYFWKKASISMEKFGYNREGG